jgi:hypothetical protein
VQSISANDLKTGGIGAVSRPLQTLREVGLSVRGELRFVEMEADIYQRLHECELEIALLETRAAPHHPRQLTETGRSASSSIQNQWRPKAQRAARSMPKISKSWGRRGWRSF